MAFAFWLAAAFSCRLLVRFRCSENVYDSQLDLRIDETLVSVGSRSFPDFRLREKPTPDQTNTTFSGQTSVGAVAATGMSSEGYIVMVIMEDLDPVDGSVLCGTIAKVEIEDVEAVSFNNGMKNNPALTTAKSPPTASTIPSTAVQIPAKPLRVISRVDPHGHIKRSISKPSSGIDPRWNMTVHERAQLYQTIAGTVNCRSSENIVNAQHIRAIQEQESSVHHKGTADNRDVSTKAIPQTGMDAAAVGIFMHLLRRRAHLRERTTQPHTNIPLENALKVLRRVDLDDMKAASDTIQKLTKDSRECCARCIEVPASQLIYNVLVRMSCEPSDPVVLRNLLTSLGNLAKYRRWKQQTRQRVTRFERSIARRQLDTRLIDMLGEMLLVLSDDLKSHQQHSWSLFTIAAGSLWDLTILVQDDARESTAADESWIATRQRLIDLRDRLIVKKQKQPVATAAMEARVDQGDLLPGYLTRAVAMLTQISSVM